MNKLNYLNVNYLKIPTKHREPHVACWPRVVSRPGFGPGSGLSLPKCFGSSHKTFV